MINSDANKVHFWANRSIVFHNKLLNHLHANYFILEREQLSKMDTLKKLRKIKHENQIMINANNKNLTYI